MTGAERDDEGLAALRRDVVGNPPEVPVRAGLVLAVRIFMDAGAEQPVEQHVAGVQIGIALAGDAMFKLNFTAHAESARIGANHAGVVGLKCAGRNDRIGARRDGLAHVKLRLTRLVATHGDTRAIVSFHK